MKKIYVCTLAVFLSFGVIFYLILTILLPVTYRRSFAVLTSEEKNYVLECYVPGRASHAIVTNDSEKARITYSEKDNETLVQIETKSRPGFLNILNVSIWFAPENEEELLPEFPPSFGNFDDEGKVSYDILENGEKAEAFQAYDKVSEGKTGAVFSVLLCTIGLAVVLCVNLAAGKVRRNHNLSYSSLVSISDDYFGKYVCRRISLEKKQWLEKRMKRCVFFQSCLAALAVMFVSGLPLWLDLTLQFWNYIGVLVLVFIGGIILKQVLALYLTIPISRIRPTRETAPEIWWYGYRLHDLDEGYGAVWSLSDLSMAMAMTLMGHPEESYAFAENIWKEFGWNLTLGKWYGLYHFIQWVNCTLTGREEERKIHRENAEKEFRRKPKKALYQRLMKIAESVK